MSNWYKTIKNAQLFTNNIITKDNSYFLENLGHLYELSYKYNVLKSMPFEGHPTRWNNIINSIKEKLIICGNYLKNILLSVFRDWLESHALLDPDKWANKKVESMLDDLTIKEIFENMINEIVFFSGDIGIRNDYKKMMEEEFRKILEDIENNPEKFPLTYNNLLEILLPEKIDRIKEDFSYYGELHTGNGIIKSEEELDKYLESIDLTDISISEIFNLDYFLEVLETNANLDTVISIVKEIYKGTVFEEWYRYWSDKGIDNTRSNLENIYNMLLNSNALDTSNFTSILNIAINSVHQNGNMSEYLSQYIGISEDEIMDKMDECTSGAYVEIWDKELKDIGVSFDINKIKNPHIYPKQEELLSDEEKVENVELV